MCKPENHQTNVQAEENMHPPSEASPNAAGPRQHLNASETVPKIVER
jgi:hypothetical protein